MSKTSVPEKQAPEDMSNQAVAAPRLTQAGARTSMSKMSVAEEAPEDMSTNQAVAAPRLTRAGARAAAAELQGLLFRELPEELLVHVIRQMRGHLLLAAAVSHRLHGIVMQLMLALPFRLDPDEGPLLAGQLSARHWSEVTTAQHLPSRPAFTLYSSPERGLVVRRSNDTGGQTGWSHLKSTQRLAPGACLTFSLRVRHCQGRETKIELMGGIILRSSATTDYDPAGDSWSYQMWNVPGKPGGFTLVAPSRVHDSAGAPWHQFAQVVNDDGQVEMYEDGRYCFTANPTPGAEELQVKFDIFQLE